MLYKPGAPDPKLTYTFDALEIGRHSELLAECRWPDADAAERAARAKQFTWPGGGQAALQGNLGGRERKHLLLHRTMGDFRLMGDAERWEPCRLGLQPRMGRSRSVANLPRCASGAPVAVRLMLDMGGAPAFFRKGSLAGLRCVSQVAK